MTGRWMGVRAGPTLVEVDGKFGQRAGIHFWAQSFMIGVVLRLNHAVRRYSWGSPSAIPNLLGLPAGQTPVAEIWLGAHRLAPAMVASADSEVDAGVSLADVIARNRLAALGQISCQELPFLLKVLGVGQPLSLQVHPTAAGAKAGYAREQAAGLGLDAPERTYKDPHPKPEMVYALTTFEVLAGFRPADQIRALLAPLTSQSELACTMTRALSQPGPVGLKAAFTRAINPKAVGDQEPGAFVAASRAQLAKAGPDPGAYAIVGALAKRYPEDGALAATLMLSRTVLAPGEALFIPPGTVHGYLRGLAMEVMGPSDNVIRVGLTGKHIDLAGATEAVDYVCHSPGRPQVTRDGPARLLRPPVADFQMADIRLDGTYLSKFSGPRIALALEGQVTAFTNLGSIHVSRGQALFAGASEGEIELRGRGRIIMAAPGNAKPILDRS